jgi:hypothetical protein
LAPEEGTLSVLLHGKGAPMTRQPRLILVGALATATLLTLSACSSGGDATTTPSASVSANPSTSIAAITQLSSACASVYEVDLLMSDYSAGAVANGDFTEQEAKADYLRLTKAINTGAKTVKDTPQATTLSTNSARSLKVLRGLSNKATLGTMAKKKATRLSNQRARMLKACAAAGFPLPAVNAQAHQDVTPTAAPSAS